MSPPHWTALRVAEQLVAAFARLPDHPVLSRGRTYSDEDGEVEPFAWPERFVADRRDRMVLMTWARCRAIGASVTARYEDLGWQRDTAERRRRKALAAIAAGLNVQAPTPLTVQSNLPELSV